MPFEVTCTNEQKKTVFVTPKTDTGRPAVIQSGSLQISVQSGDGSFEFDPTNPGMFKAVSGELLADTVYLLKADADVSDTVSEISDTVTLHVTSAQAKNFGFTEGPAEAKAA